MARQPPNVIFIAYYILKCVCRYMNWESVSKWHTLHQNLLIFGYFLYWMVVILCLIHQWMTPQFEYVKNLRLFLKIFIQKTNFFLFIFDKNKDSSQYSFTFLVSWNVSIDLFYIFYSDFNLIFISFVFSGFNLSNYPFCNWGRVSHIRNIIKKNS